MKHLPAVSVIIPIHNQENYLNKAIESVLAQTYPVDEIIVIDDGSDIPVTTIGAPNIKIVHQQNQGAAQARNRGIELCKNELIAFLDADDLWSRDKLQLQIAALSNDSDLVFTHIQQFISEDISVKKPLKNEFLPGYCASTLLTKREYFSMIGPFNPTYRVGEFIEWYVRAQKCKLKITMLPQVLTYRRIHQNNHGSKNKTDRADYLKILHKHIASHE